jgi:predicted nucleic acid-binding protein
VILVDTSVWIDYFRSGLPRLAADLEADEVLLHPWVLGELALGQLGPRRARILADLALLPAAPLIPDEVVLGLVDRRTLSGSGIGWVDAQLLASSLVAGARLWTNDRRLHRAAVSAA